MKKTFYVLTDDKVGSGPRLRPQSLLKSADKEPEKAADSAQPMDTDADATEVTDPPPKASVPPKALSLSAKLAAKRKTTDTEPVGSASKARR